MRHFRYFAAAILVALVAGSAPARAGDLNATASCPDGTHILIQWDWYETPGSPVAYPEWVGYDVLRRVAGSCETFVRLNADPFPRVVGVSHSGSTTDTPPATLTTYEYEVVPVDASHQPVIMSSVDCEPPCVPHAWASAPDRSGIVTLGTLVDWGWTVAVQPCAGSCWTGCYLADPVSALALRPYAGTAQVLAFYGTIGWGSVEGPSLLPDRWEPAGCGPTPTARTSWGEMKIRYR